MTRAGLVRMLLSRDPWARVEAWRRFRASIAPGHKPTFDAYPDRVEQPDMAVYLEARDALGRLLRERVDLRGYSVNHINFEHKAWRDGIVDAMEVSRTVLRARLRLAEIDRARRDEARAHRAYERAVERERRG